MGLSWPDREWLQKEFDKINYRLWRIQQGELEIMSDQDTTNELAARIGMNVEGLKLSGAAIQAEIAKLIAANPTVDFSGLSSVVGELDVAAGDIASLAPVFQNVRLLSDGDDFTNYQTRLVKFNENLPTQLQVPAEQYLTHTDDGTGTWDLMVAV